MITWRKQSEVLAEYETGAFTPGRANELVEIAEGIDSNPICLPLVVLRGESGGPRVWLQAQTHGDEPNPTESIMRLLADATAPSSGLRGVLVVAPAMHSAAVRHFSREAPLDGKNGNRIWGVDWTRLGHTKTFSYIWMHRVAEMIQSLKPDLVIDMHDGGVPLRIMSHALYRSSGGADDAKLDDLCIQSGMKVIWPSQGGRFGGSVNDQMHELGIPSVMLEAGGTGQIIEEDVVEMSFGLRNVLRSIGMLPGDPTPRSDEQIRMESGSWVRADRAGLFTAKVGLGQMVVRGDVIGVIRNMFGEEVQQIHAPHDGLVFGLRYQAVANLGDYVANVGQIK